MSESFSWAPQAQVLPIDAWINLRRVNQKGCKLTTKIHSTIVSILVCLLSNMKGENLTGHRPNSHVKIGTIREGHSLGIPSSSHKSTQSRPKYRKSSSAALRSKRQAYPFVLVFFRRRRVGFLWMAMAMPKCSKKSAGVSIHPFGMEATKRQSICGTDNFPGVSGFNIPFLEINVSLYCLFYRNWSN